MVREKAQRTPRKTLRTHAQQGAEALVVVRKRCNGRGAKGGPDLRTRFGVNRKGGTPVLTHDEI